MNAPSLFDWQRGKEAEGHYVYRWRGYTIHLWTEHNAAELWQGDAMLDADAEGDVHWLAHVAYETEDAR